jgi:cyclopropane-fatty-acyl-phospholipid synthase
VHAIGLNAKDNRNDPFIQKYIFPGSDTPRLSAMAQHIEANDMAVIDVENICRHYAVTTRCWLKAFRANQGRLDAERYDHRFKRMWEYYLCVGVAAALAGDLAVYQVLFTNDYHADYRLQRI